MVIGNELESIHVKVHFAKIAHQLTAPLLGHYRKKNQRNEIALFFSTPQLLFEHFFCNLRRYSKSYKQKTKN